VIRVFLVNLVPLWGFTQEHWSGGTTLALYWLQTLGAIPLTALLVVTHRRLTRKAGHFSGVTTTRDSRGHVTVKRSTFLSGFLWMSIPFTLAHGIFLAALLGLLWRDADGGVNPEDLRQGALAMLGALGVGFMTDLLGLQHKPFSWIQFRAGAVVSRTLLVHLVIIFGMALAMFFERDAAAFFMVFMLAKVLLDVLTELPTYDPKEPPAWFSRIMDRLGDRPGEFAEYWKSQRAQQIENARIAEQTIDSLDAPAPSR
jgi:hypothetical protein